MSELETYFFPLTKLKMLGVHQEPLWCNKPLSNNVLFLNKGIRGDIYKQNEYI